MPLPNVNPLILDEMIVFISGALMECFSADEQAVIGTFLATLGSVISFNSVYSLYTEGLATIQDPKDSKDAEDTDDNKNEDHDYDLIKRTIDKLQEEVTKIQQSKP